jgi:hypothetical protein
MTARTAGPERRLPDGEHAESTRPNTPDLCRIRQVPPQLIEVHAERNVNRETARKAFWRFPCSRLPGGHTGAGPARRADIAPRARRPRRTARTPYHPHRYGGRRLPAHGGAARLFGAVVDWMERACGGRLFAEPARIARIYRRLRSWSLPRSRPAASGHGRASREGGAPAKRRAPP